MNRLALILLPILAFYLSVNPVALMSSEDPLAVGASAPDFSLPYATKEEIVWDGITLSDIIGESLIVLAFYPANWSGGCTQQLCLYRDNFSALSDLNATILAISGDYVYSHHEWAKQQDFPFKLLSDHLHEVASLYDSYNAERGFNRRTVFVIDHNGNIAYRDMNYSVADEADYNALKAALESLQ
jgi:glutaredoxin-dependent peroxiredoxin